MECPPASELAWVAVIAAGAVLETAAIRSQSNNTLSAHTRRIFRTQTPLGRAVFLATLATGADVFARHITKE